MGLAYIDLDCDLTSPAAGNGIADWMGVTHLLDAPDADPRLAALDGRPPLLTPDTLRLVAADLATPYERDRLTSLGLSRSTSSEVGADPAAALDALTSWADDLALLSVHVDAELSPQADHGPSTMAVASVAALRRCGGSHRHRRCSHGRAPQLCGVVIGSRPARLGRALGSVMFDDVFIDPDDPAEVMEGTRDGWRRVTKPTTATRRGRPRAGPPPSRWCCTARRGAGRRWGTGGPVPPRPGRHRRAPTGHRGGAARRTRA